MQYIYNDKSDKNFSDSKSRLQDEETTPILPGRKKKSNYLIFKLLYTILAISVIALIIFLAFTFLWPSQDPSVEIDFQDNDNLTNTEVVGRLRQSYNGNTGNFENKLKQNDFTDTAPVNPIVEISSGKIRGTSLKSRDGRHYSAFYGIPYAEPPVGELRFQAPEPYKAKWSGIRDATKRTGKESQCMQVSGGGASGTEDCLKLQVFTPKLPAAQRRNPKLPVMVYIFGGGSMFGRASRYGADYMMDEDVVLVLFDYRVGALGHLNTGDLEIRGNMGYKDQAMALKWVQENIKKFGGDPKKVLIFGNSSGAASVHSHIISPMSKGLFSRAVSQSGTVNLPIANLVRPVVSARFLGEELNCTNVEDTKELRKCLNEADAADIASIPFLMNFLSKEAIPDNGDLSQVFMPDSPMNLLKEGKFDTRIPWIVGGNSAELYMIANELLRRPELVNTLDKTWNNLAPFMFGFKDNNETHEKAKDIRQLYFGSKQINIDTRYNLTNILSDVTFIHPMKIAGDYHALFGGSAYSYFLTHEPTISYGEATKEGFPPPYGVAHADEVQLFFPFDKFLYISKESRDYNFSKTIIKMWTDFARTGKPSHPNLKEWPRLPVYRKDAPKTRWLEFNDTSQLMQPLVERMTFLDSFPFRIPEMTGAEIISTGNAVLDFVIHLRRHIVGF